MQKILMEQFIKYGSVGFLGTLIHYSWLIALSQNFPAISPAYFAFSGAFMGAVVNYILNYHYTFFCVKKHVWAFPQFVFLTVFSMLASTLIVQTALNFNLHYIVGQILATAICFPIGFIINKKVVFNE